MTNQPDKKVIPFLKWAGGKRWLVKSFSDRLDVRFQRYVEPFAGSGAVFFHLCPHNALIADMNPKLIETYQAIKDDWKRVAKELAKHGELHSKDYYYHIRSKRFRTLHKRAAQFIYLNRTCFNGIYRVNLKGEFNVPIGTKNRVLLGTDNFEEVSKKLQGAEIRCSDFEETLSQCGNGDFVFVDPPYTVKHNFNGFVKYNEKIFSWADQIRLRDAIISGAGRGAQFLISNADHECIHELYEDVGTMESANRNSFIAASSSKRGKTSEVLIRIE